MKYKIQITQEMKRQFRSETTEHLNNFEKMLMGIEKEPGNHDAIHAAFRDIHSIKGNSDYLGIKDINTLAHDLEDLMDDIRNAKQSADRKVLAVLFEGLHLLRDMNRRIANENYEETDISDIQARIRQTKSSDSTELFEEKSETEYAAGLFSDVIEQEIKVDIEKIDKFMSHISEFTITKNTLNYLTRKAAFDDLTAEWIGELKKISANMDRIAGNLQTDIMKLRLVKINTLFERLPGIVRDLSLRSGKKIELAVTGGETEIDRKTVEFLIDPLIHIIRNAVDHGIEFPSDRIKKDKSETGTINIESHQEGSYAIIDITDNGKGLDTDQIRKTALERNIVTEDALAAMENKDILNLIFLPGFSTLPNATTVSGRGVGLDIVRNNIKNIGGSIVISGEKDEGTCIKLRIPVAMSLTDVLLTEVAGRRYAFPLAVILKTIKVKRKNIHALKKREMMLWGDAIIPIQYLGEILEITLPEKFGKKDSDQELSVVVIMFENKIRAIIVDNILRRETILIKPLEKYLSGIKELHGAALLGDGTIALVIEPMGIISG